jgi:hypothetical protein
MTPFTTSKGEFIAIDGEESEKAFGPVISVQRWGGDSIIYTHKDGTQTISEHDHDFEIIGLSSAILKEEELAKKVAEPGFSCLACVWIFKAHNITGNQLIIKKK